MQHTQNLCICDLRYNNKQYSIITVNAAFFKTIHKKKTCMMRPNMRLYSVRKTGDEPDCRKPQP